MLIDLRIMEYLEDMHVSLINSLLSTFYPLLVDVKRTRNQRILRIACSHYHTTCFILCYDVYRRRSVCPSLFSAYTISADDAVEGKL